MVSFHFGRFHGFQKVPEGHKESKVEEVNDVHPQVKDVLPQVFMTRKGTVLHVNNTPGISSHLPLYNSTVLVRVDS